MEQDNHLRTKAGADMVPIAPFTALSDSAVGEIGRIYETLPPNRDTLGLLFALDAAQTDPTDRWTAFFVETASAQLIWDERPTGVLDPADAAWVLARFDDAPTVATLAVLVRLVEEAQKLPVWFAADVRKRAELFAPALRPARETPAARRAPHLRLVA